LALKNPGRSDCAQVELLAVAVIAANAADRRKSRFVTVCGLRVDRLCIKHSLSNMTDGSARHRPGPEHDTGPRDTACRRHFAI
ncbi:hypothetical protein, partial [Bradyrhizobium pachyrhizi]|uniref:hypothetical protein n=1 Tax=Bradyrhizobium pachyrhizi TaxID=280333 RepID=UPI001FCCE334